MSERGEGWPGWPVFDAEQRAAVEGILRSGRVNYWNGIQGREFENEFAEAVGSRHAVALANGTVALEGALHALGIGPGDDVVVTSRSFVASAGAIVLCGARPIFADVDAGSQNITAGTVSNVLSPKTKAIIAVHLAGWPCPMDELIELATHHDLKIIEDCAQAHGATLNDRSVGSFGHVAAWSFCTDKIMSTGGEGGMVTTNSREIWERVWSHKDHGKSWDAVHNREHPVGFRWLHESFGTNWRLTEMQSAIGRIQLKRLREWVRVRRRNAGILTESLRETPALRLTEPPAEVGHAYYKYYAFVRPECLREGWTRDRIIAEIMARGIPCGSGSCPEIYREKAFVDAGYGPEARFPVARQLGETSLMFQVHPTLTVSDMERAATVVQDVMGLASR